MGSSVKAETAQAIGRGRMFMFHRTLDPNGEQWRDWESELWKLTRRDPAERRLWATVLALALADVYRGRAKLARDAWTWMIAQPKIGDADEPMWNRVGAFQWICNELGLCPRTIRRDVRSDVQQGKTRAMVAAL